MNPHKIIRGKFCKYCGTKERYEHTNECVGCYHYRQAVKSGNILGVDGRKEKAKLKKAHYE